MHSEDIRVFLIFFFVSFDEVLYGRIRIVFGECGYIVAIFQSFFTSDFSQFRGFPTVAAQYGNVQAQFASLFNDFGNFFIVTGNIECFRVGSFDFGQGSFEVQVFGKECFFSYDFAAVFNNSSGESCCQTFGIVGRRVFQDSDVFSFQSVVSKCCHNLTLERVDEASTEHKRFNFAIVVNGQARSGTGRSNVRNFVSFGNRSACCYATGSCRADNCDNFILGYQFGNGVTGFGRFGFVIGFNDNDFFAEYAAFSISFVHGHFNAGQNVFAVHSNVTGQFEGSTDFDFVGFSFFFFAAAACQYGSANHCC